MLKFTIRLFLKFFHFVLATIFIVLGIIGLILPLVPGVVLIFGGLAILFPRRTKKWYRFFKTRWQEKKSNH